MSFREGGRALVEGNLFRLSMRYKMLPQGRQQSWRIDDVVPTCELRAPRILISRR
ncbi:MAG TPA: hypothetical protein VFA15_03140 [Nitrososphaera sp.]|nr:hypothetical protein [Nitrososphaera sp.]